MAVGINELRDLKLMLPRGLYIVVMLLCI